MNKILLLFAFALGNTAVFGQVVWNKRLPLSIGFPNLYELSSDGDSYFVSSYKDFYQLNINGDITSHVNETIGLNAFWVWGAKITSSNTGIPYLLISRVSGQPSTYTLAHFQPGTGIVNQYMFTDSIGSLAQSKGPVFVSIGDSILYFFGQKFVRKIHHQSDGAFSEAWAYPMTFKTIGAVWTGSHGVFCDPFGNFKAIDASGNLLWEKTHPFSVNSIKLLPDGIIGCGNANTGEGLVFKLDFDGNLLWSNMLAEKRLNDLTAVADGGIMLTGETDSMTLNWHVIKTDGTGNPLWEQTYEKGKGWEIEQAPDGGAVVLWHTTTGANRLRLAKIDAMGNTVLNDTEIAEVAERTLRTSGAKTTQYPLTGLFFDGSDSRLNVPADSATSPIFVNSPWIAGNDMAGNLHLAATSYGNNQQDYRAGLASSPSEDFNRVWSVTREQIASIRRDYGEDGDLDVPPPFDLLTWPAKGNPHFLQNLNFTLVSTNPDSLPAPFVDKNSDGFYNVFEGDYPRLLGDRMLWWARTDQTIHEESDGQPLGVDVLIVLYGYDCPQNGSISQTLFAEYQVINRSGDDYSETYMGLFTDFDLGCDEDDYTGCIPDANTTYVYNQDDVDGQPGSNCPSGAPTYGDKVPVESITLLNHTLDHAMYFNRAGLVPQTAPATPLEFYNYLQSIWSDGVPLTIGGSGYDPGNPVAVPTNYAFPDNPSDPQGWTMCTANLANADRRMINSHGPFTFATGDTFTMRLAFTFHPDIPHPCPDVAGLVKPTILQIQQWHDDGTLDAPLDLGSVLQLASGQSLLLDATQPNPATTYAWSTGATTPSITVNQTGEYTVTVTRASGCAYTETVWVKSATGTSSPTLPAWQMQPNPAHDVLKIIFENLATPATALLYNSQGQLVATKNSLGNSLEFSVANLPAGLYWAEVWREGKFLGSRKVVVAR